MTLQNNKMPQADSPIRVISLGGTDRVGMNATLIGQNGRYILIDLGATFVAGDDLAAKAIEQKIGGTIERIVPDLDAVAPLMDRVEAIVLTHAHQDHIGAMPTLFLQEHAEKLRRIPIYATAYTGEIIEQAFEEYRIRPEIRIAPRHARVPVGPFEVEWVAVTHSAPDTSLVVLHTDIGAVVIGTDIKSDDHPLLGPATDFDHLQKIGDAGVLAFLADSTNAHRQGRSKSESEVRDGFADLMSRHRGRVVISTFSSNVARVVAAHQAGQQTGRSLALMGRSLLMSVEAARNTGLLDPSVKTYTPQELADCPGQHSVLVCTGSQAEEGSALRHMVDRLGTTRSGLQVDDMFIHSARTIPGNEHSVNEMLEAMRRFGIRVVTAEEGSVHASGHAHREELGEFYQALRPRFAIPMHGTRDLTGHHVEFAQEYLDPRCIVSPREGDIVEISANSIAIVGHVQTRTMAAVRYGTRRGPTKLIPWPPEATIEIAAA